MDEERDRRLAALEASASTMLALIEEMERSAEREKAALHAALTEVRRVLLEDYAGGPGAAPRTLINEALARAVERRVEGVEKKDTGFFAGLLGPLSGAFDRLDDNKNLGAVARVVVGASVVLMLCFWLFIGGGMERLGAGLKYALDRMWGPVQVEAVIKPSPPDTTGAL